jgi:hypothetical protein
MNTIRTYLIASLVILTFSTQMAAQSQAPKGDIVKVIRDLKAENCSFLEVSKEMFELMASDEKMDVRIKEYFTKMNHLIYLQCHPTRDKNEALDVAANFEKMAEDNNFKLLMRSESGQHKNLFYKRDSGDINEYLLATQSHIQYISTTMDITSIREMTQIIEIAGQAGGL